MKRIRITRTAQLPDPIRLSRYAKAPELGPRILFFSGGSALNGLSRVLKRYTHNSIHMVTPFDSGGSSAKLRQAFNMPSIGDLRSRLMALADESVTGHPEIYKLFTYRFPKEAEQKQLLSRYELMTRGKDPLVETISNPMRRVIRNLMGYFRDAMPDDFDLRGASIGNLILAGGYLNNHQHLDPVIFLFSKLVGVNGTVRATVNDDLHLAADLDDGSRVLGQHLMTGKEVPPLNSSIRRLRLSSSLQKMTAATAELRKKNRKLIQNAELICYPPGSFYSSLVANLLPAGVGSAIACNDCPKIYIPNAGDDPEQIGMDFDASLSTLLDYIKADLLEPQAESGLISFVLMDSGKGNKLSRRSINLLESLEIQLINTPLFSKRSGPYYDPELLSAALLSLT